MEQRRLMGGIELLYEILAENEYREVAARPELGAARSAITLIEHASKVDDLQHEVSLPRPHLPKELYQQFRLCSAFFVARIQMKAIQQRHAGTFMSWTDLDDGPPIYHCARWLLAFFLPMRLMLYGLVRSAT